MDWTSDERCIARAAAEISYLVGVDSVTGKFSAQRQQGSRLLQLVRKSKIIVWLSLESVPENLIEPAFTSAVLTQSPKTPSAVPLPSNARQASVSKFASVSIHLANIDAHVELTE
jgi:hypothetical protein